jgi:hypothetical protein
MPTRFLTVTSGIKFNYTSEANSELPEIGNGTADINANNITDFNLKFPVIYKPNVVITGGLRYNAEHFYFDDIEPDNYPLFLSLNDRNLSRLGFKFNGFIHTGGNRSLVVRSTIYLAGDFYRDNSTIPLKDLLKGSLAMGYAINRDSTSYFGFGVYAGYKFGVPSIYPALLYFRQFPNGLGFDALLPQKIQLWKKVHDRFYIHVQSRVIGNSYAIKVHDTVLDQAESLQLRQSAIINSIGFSTQINKWLWFEANAGYTFNLNFKVSESSFVMGSTLMRADNEYLIVSNVSGAPYISLSLSLAFPKGFLDSFLNKKAETKNF